MQSGNTVKIFLSDNEGTSTLKNRTQILAGSEQGLSLSRTQGPELGRQSLSNAIDALIARRDRSRDILR